MEEDFSTRLKRLRNERNYTQAQLAGIVNVATKTISNYEQRISEPQAVLLLALAQALDVTPEYLLLGESNMNNYTQAIKAELEQLTTFNQIKQIKDEDFNSTILAHLEMTNSLVDTITRKWNASITLFRDDGNPSYFTKPYVQETIIKYCQNRQKYIKIFKLTDGMISYNTNNSLSS